MLESQEPELGVGTRVLVRTNERLRTYRRYSMTTEEKSRAERRRAEFGGYIGPVDGERVRTADVKGLDGKHGVIIEINRSAGRLKKLAYWVRLERPAIEISFWPRQLEATSTR